jgi:hypothetical protein
MDIRAYEAGDEALIASIWHPVGAGSRLLDWARQQSPQGLELHTHQQNTRARNSRRRLHN